DLFILCSNGFRVYCNTAKPKQTTRTTLVAKGVGELTATWTMVSRVSRCRIFTCSSNVPGILVSISPRHCATNVSRPRIRSFCRRQIPSLGRYRKHVAALPNRERRDGAAVQGSYKPSDNAGVLERRNVGGIRC